MKSFIGYSTDADIRFKATSGGIGTSLMKWMFDKGIIGTSISFDFDANSLRYVPKMIHSFSDYSVCGSIYQEIDLIGFIKSHLDEISGTFACFTLPCQTRAVRTIVERAGHEAFIIGLTCSSQQTLEATKYLLKRVGIGETDVNTLQYRGNGWPSGIQIETKGGEKVVVSNSHSIWNKIFHSRLFVRQKCFMCQDTLNKYSDLSLADPWLNEYKSDKIGQTICTCFSIKGFDYLNLCNRDGCIVISEISFEKVICSQNKTIYRKKCYKELSLLSKWFQRLVNSKFYRFLIFKCNMFLLHDKMKNLFERFLLRNTN